MRTPLFHHFYVQVFDRFPDAPDAKIHPHFTLHHAYPVLAIRNEPGHAVTFLVADDRGHFRYAEDQHCVLIDDGLIWQKDN